MGDLKFKIGGNFEPFIAQICLNGCNTVLQQKIIEHSGSTCCSCNIFGGLFPNTTYSLSVRDNIGNSISTGFTTPVTVGTTTLATKTINLAGVPNSPAGSNNCCVTDCLNISPALSMGECVNLCFNSCTLGDSNNGLYSNVSVSCKANGTNNWISVKYDINNNFQTIPQITLCEGDLLRYSISTSFSSCCTCCSTPTATSGCSVLTLFCAIPFGFNETILNNTLKTNESNVPTTTTTTTTLTPIIVNFVPVDLTTNPLVCGCKYGTISTTPALTSGQSFRICFVDCAQSSSLVNLPQSISSCSYVCTVGDTNCCNTINTVLQAQTTSNCLCHNYDYIDINTTNINSLRFYAIANSNLSNCGYNYTNCATVSMFTIACKIGGNFILGTNTTVSEFNTISSNSCCCGCGSCC